ncbi:MAG: hypothetical protein V1255_04465, partial [Alphaproteobacteria bacterium]|nr:hypothetical protein [Alphaproteobacteria bacterium]
MAATISEHLISSRSGDFSQLYHMVTKIPASFCSVPPHNVGANQLKARIAANIDEVAELGIFRGSPVVGWEEDNSRRPYLFAAAGEFSGEFRPRHAHVHKDRNPAVSRFHHALRQTLPLLHGQAGSFPDVHRVCKEMHPIF